MTYLERAITDGHAKLTGEGKQQKILYVAVNHTERYADPEEQVRAEFWAELIYRYGYEPARIGIEITVPDRTPSDRADLVVFRDDERKKPYTVIECKQDGVTDAEFNQAVEQSCGNQTKHFRQLNGLNGLHGGWHGSNHVSNTRFELRNHIFEIDAGLPHGFINPELGLLIGQFNRKPRLILGRFQDCILHGNIFTP